MHRSLWTLAFNFSVVLVLFYTYIQRSWSTVAVIEFFVALKMTSISDKKLDIKEENQPFKPKIVWRNVAIMGAVHLASLYALTILHKAKFSTILWGKLTIVFIVWQF